MKNYNCPQIKPIYPVYKLQDNLFRIGAQKGITVEFGEVFSYYPYYELGEVDK